MRTMPHVALLAAATLAFTALVAQAQDQPRTRAQVRAEVMRAQASGELQRLQTDYAPGNWSPMAQRSASLSTGTGAQGRAFDTPAPAARMPAPVAMPLGDEGE
ncbi:DUF4148 domain-containing protein [Azohydromonas aeria]|uniref:DUF4148 domain-containing protein n=1 Tax=Azohydromonas aeria TaxID=2590212 RepID=UPI0012FC04D4|nr:DUF4148 domain-containing protein [Azohydromonas aeria]